ncbi:MAG: 4'-phosphopantetheinyl transferase superfamily protein [Candidatus Lambdaproteobacteria bacterium]|nr:4'-phosphopantetheinyl transferase superfamily protein [Candidatus Lambdaproteobacteria bacterium]
MELPVLPAERALLGAAPSPERAHQFALGRACAREALARLGVAHATTLPLLRGLGRAPRWPEAVVGSLSHTREMAAAAVAWAADYHGLGLDLESERVPSARLVERILRPEERAERAALPPEAWDLRFALVFSAKESVYKALNPATGMFLGFQDARIEFPAGEGASSPGAGTFAWRLERACGPHFPPGTVGPGRWRAEGRQVLTAVWVAK